MVEWTSIKVSVNQRVKLNKLKDILDKESIGSVHTHHVIDHIFNSSSIESLRC